MVAIRIGLVVALLQGPVALAEDCITRDRSSSSIGGQAGSRVGEFRPGDIVGVLDPKNPGEYRDVIVIDTFITTEEKPNSPGSDLLQQRRYTVLVPPATPDGDAIVATVDNHGRQVGTPGTIPEYVAAKKENIAAYLRNSKALQAITQRQLAEAGAKLAKLNQSTEEFNKRYATAEGLTRLTAEIAIAIAVEELSTTALPDQYKGLDKESTEAINSIVKPTLDVLGDAAKKGVNGKEGERLGEAALDAGIAGTSGYTFGPILDQLEKAGKFGVPGSEEAKKKVGAIKAVTKGLVKAAAAGQLADDGEGLREAQLALLDELYGYILPVPGANVLYSDATKMGVMLTDYSIVTNELRNVAGNQRVAIDANRRYRGAQNALENLRCYEQRIRKHAKVPYAAPAATAQTAATGIVTISGGEVPALVTSTGWNGSRGATSRPTATGAVTTDAGSATTSAGTKR